MNPVTQKDIAAETGYSLMTVSRALKGSPKVSSKTKTAIKEAADRLGYRPDPMLSALVNYRNKKTSGYHKVAILSAFPEDNDWPNRNRMTQLTMKGIQAACEGYGFESELFNLNAQGGHLAKTLDILHARGIESILLLPSPRHFSGVYDDDHAGWDRFQIVQIENNEHRPQCTFVRHNPFDAVTTLWNECWKRGYRRIGLAVNNVNRGKQQGYMGGAYLWKQYQMIEETEPIPPLKELRLTKDAFLSYIEENRLDAIICGSKISLPWCREAGISIPDELGWVCTGVHEDDEDCAGIMHQHEHVGRHAVDLLNRLKLDRQFGEDENQQGIFLKGLWKEGPTVRPL